MATHSSIVARRIPWTETRPAALHKLLAGAPCLDQTGKWGGSFPAASECGHAEPTASLKIK